MRAPETVDRDQSFVWEEREKEMEREKGVDDGLCLSTDPAKRRLGA